jgi:hypothetical protein
MIKISIITSTLKCYTNCILASIALMKQNEWFIFKDLLINTLLAKHDIRVLQINQVRPAFHTVQGGWDAIL